MQLISDDALDRFADGWTPEQVRNLVHKYREAKRTIEAVFDGLDLLASKIDDMQRLNPQLVCLDEEETPPDRGRLVDGPAFREGLKYAHEKLYEAIP